MKNLKNKVLYVEHGKYKITPFGIRFLSLALKKKFSYRKIAEKLGISAETLSYRCREYNISSRKDIPGRKKKYPFLENYFEKYNCKSFSCKVPEEKIPSDLQKYWILGYLDEDGTISIYGEKNRYTLV